MRLVNVHKLSYLTKCFFCKKFSTRANNGQSEVVVHCPVMANEAVSFLNPSEGSSFIDMTFGAGGHTKYLLAKCTSLKVFALDRDPIAYDYAKELSKEYPDQVIPLLGRFSELPQLLLEHKVKKSSFDGILFDFGCSSMQFDVAQRGFAISKDGPLDMRMDGERFPNNPKASDVLALAEEEDLFKIFKIYGEEKLSKKIARAIIEARYTFKSFRTTKELADFVSGVCEKDFRLDKLQRNAHIATKIFQALRIFVNNELNEINYGMIVAQKYLKVGGRMVTISFHSLEDTIVKRHITGHIVNSGVNKLPQKYMNYATCHNLEDVEHLMSSKWAMIHKHVITPTEEEVLKNPRSRSAKLRAVIKLED